MVPRGRELGVGAAPGEEGRIPAADEVKPVRVEDRLQRLGPARELVAQLHPLEAVGLGEALFERDVTAQLRHVVVGPTDRVGADADWR